jgi:molybdopterin synthase sulfur carrier subunit
MLLIHYFASTREKVGLSDETVQFNGEVATVAALIELLSSRHTGFSLANEPSNKLLVSVNQTVVDRSYKLHDGDEVAFFPPMTGG